MCSFNLVMPLFVYTVALWVSIQVIVHCCMPNNFPWRKQYGYSIGRENPLPLLLLDVRHEKVLRITLLPC